MRAGDVSRRGMLDDMDERHPADFFTTQWSLVLAGGRPEDGDAGRALSALCQRYWYPLYAYVRRRVASPHEAQDLTQAFFARLLEKNTVAQASPERGRFRAFLLTAMKNFLANEWDKARTQKRGGGQPPLTLDFPLADQRLEPQAADEQSPELIFERQWALTLLETALGQLRDEHLQREKGEQFEQLKPLLAGEAEATLAAAAKRLGMSTGAVKVAVHRLRRRYRELLRSAIAETVADPSEVDDEIRRLFATLGRAS